MEHIVEVKDLKKKYKDKEAVKGVRFNVEKGEIFGFLGPNGAGKSTTINMLSTIIQPSCGEAFVNGYDNVKEKNKVRASIGLIFPAPFGPKKPNISPFSTLKRTPFTASLSLYFFFRSFTSTICSIPCHSPFS